MHFDSLARFLLICFIFFSNLSLIVGQAATKTISETGTTTRTLTITLNVNAAMAIGETITISGLTGSSTADTTELTIGGADAANTA